MANIKDLIGLTRETQKLKRQLDAERGALKIRAAELNYERKHLLNAPLNKDDMLEALRDDLRDAAAEALKDGDLLQAIRDCQNRPSARIEDYDRRALYPPIPRKIRPEALALFVGVDAIISRVQPAIDALSFEQAGPAVHERRERIKAIDDELASLARQREEMDRVLGEEEAPPPAKPGPALGDKIERRDEQGRLWVATWAQPTPYGSPGWVWSPADQPAPDLL